MNGESFWDELADAEPGAHALGRWIAPEVLPKFTFLERIRQALPEDEESPQATADLLAWHSRHRGAGFGGVWRGPDDEVLSPRWLTLHSIAADQSTGRVAAAGHLDYGYWGIGVEAPSFLLINGLYVGNLKTGNFVPLDLSISVSAVDLNPVNGEIAVLHHLANSTFAVSIVSELGARRLLTILEGINGGEAVRYSPDGQWLLVSRSKGTYLINAATGSWLELTIGNTGWDPSVASSVVVIEHKNGNATPRRFNLRENSYRDDFPSIELDVPLLESFPYVWSPVVSGNGDEVLVVTTAGVSVEYQKTHGTGDHLALFNLATGRGSLTTPVFANPECTLERDVMEMSWSDTSDTSWSLTLKADLQTQLNKSVVVPSDPDWISDGRWADEAEIVLISLLNSAIELVRRDESVSHLMPEIVAALLTIAKTIVWDRQSEWLTNLRDVTASMVASGELQGSLATPWLRFALAIRAIEQGESDKIRAVRIQR